MSTNIYRFLKISYIQSFPKFRELIDVTEKNKRETSLFNYNLSVFDECKKFRLFVKGFLIIPIVSKYFILTFHYTNSRGSRVGSKNKLTED